MKCNKCGEKINSSDEKCSKCGHTFSDETNNLSKVAKIALGVETAVIGSGLAMPTLNEIEKLKPENITVNNTSAIQNNVSEDSTNNSTSPSFTISSSSIKVSNQDGEITDTKYGNDSLNIGEGSSKQSEIIEIKDDIKEENRKGIEEDNDSYLNNTIKSKDSPTTQEIKYELVDTNTDKINDNDEDEIISSEYDNEQTEEFDFSTATFDEKLAQAEANSGMGSGSDFYIDSNSLCFAVSTITGAKTDSNTEAGYDVIASGWSIVTQKINSLKSPYRSDDITCEGTNAGLKDCLTSTSSKVETIFGTSDGEGFLSKIENQLGKLDTQMRQTNSEYAALWGKYNSEYLLNNMGEILEITDSHEYDVVDSAKSYFNDFNQKRTELEQNNHSFSNSAFRAIYGDTKYIETYGAEKYKAVFGEDSYLNYLSIQESYNNAISDLAKEKTSTISKGGYDRNSELREHFSNYDEYVSFVESMNAAIDSRIADYESARYGGYEQTKLSLNEAQNQMTVNLASNYYGEGITNLSEEEIKYIETIAASASKISVNFPENLTAIQQYVLNLSNISKSNEAYNTSKEDYELTTKPYNEACAALEAFETANRGNAIDDLSTALYEEERQKYVDAVNETKAIMDTAKQTMDNQDYWKCKSENYYLETKRSSGTLTTEENDILFGNQSKMNQYQSNDYEKLANIEQDNAISAKKSSDKIQKEIDILQRRYEALKEHNYNNKENIETDILKQISEKEEEKAKYDKIFIDKSTLSANFLSIQKSYEWEKNLCFKYMSDFDTASVSNISSHSIEYSYNNEGDRYANVTFVDKNGKKYKPSNEEIAAYFALKGITIDDIQKDCFDTSLNKKTTELINTFNESECDNLLPVLSYLYNKTGKKSDDYKALENLIYDEGAKNIGYKNAEEFNNKLALKSDDEFLDWLRVSGKSIGDGLNTWASGYDNLFNADGRVSAKEYESSAIANYLNENYGTFMTGTYEVGSSIGNMLPSVVAGIAITAFTGGLASGAAAGTIISSTKVLKAIQLASSFATMGLSVGGNSFEQGLQQGMTRGQAGVYAALTASSEVGLQYILGGIPGISNLEKFSGYHGLTGFLAKGLSEGLEESAQEILEPIIKSALTGENAQIDLGQVLKAGVYGAITAGLMNGGTLVIDSTSYVLTGDAGAISFLMSKYAHTDLTLSENLTGFKSDLKSMSEIKGTQYLTNLKNQLSSSSEVKKAYEKAKLHHEAECSTTGVKTEFSNFKVYVEQMAYEQAILQSNISKVVGTEQGKILMDISLMQANLTDSISKYNEIQAKMGFDSEGKAIEGPIETLSTEEQIKLSQESAKILDKIIESRNSIEEKNLDIYRKYVELQEQSNRENISETEKTNLNIQVKALESLLPEISSRITLDNTVQSTQTDIQNLIKSVENAERLIASNNELISKLNPSVESEASQIKVLEQINSDMQNRIDKMNAKVEYFKEKCGSIIAKEIETKIRTLEALQAEIDYLNNQIEELTALLSTSINTEEVNKKIEKFKERIEKNNDLIEKNNDEISKLSSLTDTIIDDENIKSSTETMHKKSSYLMQKIVDNILEEYSINEKSVISEVRATDIKNKILESIGDVTSLTGDSKAYLVNSVLEDVFGVINKMIITPASEITIQSIEKMCNSINDIRSDIKKFGNDYGLDSLLSQFDEIEKIINKYKTTNNTIDESYLFDLFNKVSSLKENIENTLSTIEDSGKTMCQEIIVQVKDIMLGALEDMLGDPSIELTKANITKTMIDEILINRSYDGVNGQKAIINSVVKRMLSGERLTESTFKAIFESSIFDANSEFSKQYLHDVIKDGININGVNINGNESLANAISDIYAKARKSTTEVGAMNQLHSYCDHTEAHVLQVAFLSVASYSEIVAYSKANNTELNINESGKLVEMLYSGLFHDLGMAVGECDSSTGKPLNPGVKISVDKNSAGEAVLDTEIINIFTKKMATIVREGHSLNSALLVLSNRTLLESIGLDPDRIALLCFSHSKSNSGVVDLSESADWSFSIQKILTSVEEINRYRRSSGLSANNDISFNINKFGNMDTGKVSTSKQKFLPAGSKTKISSKLKVNKFNFNPGIIDDLSLESLALRIGDAYVSKAQIKLDTPVKWYGPADALGHRKIYSATKFVLTQTGAYMAFDPTVTTNYDVNSKVVNSSEIETSDVYGYAYFTLEGGEMIPWKVNKMLDSSGNEVLDANNKKIYSFGINAAAVKDSNGIYTNIEKSLMFSERVEEKVVIEANTDETKIFATDEGYWYSENIDTTTGITERKYYKKDGSGNLIVTSAVDIKISNSSITGTISVTEAENIYGKDILTSTGKFLVGENNISYGIKYDEKRNALISTYNVLDMGIFPFNTITKGIVERIGEIATSSNVKHGVNIEMSETQFNEYFEIDAYGNIRAKDGNEIANTYIAYIAVLRAQNHSISFAIHGYPITSFLGDIDSKAFKDIFSSVSKQSDIDEATHLVTIRNKITNKYGEAIDIPESLANLLYNQENGLYLKDLFYSKITELNAKQIEAYGKLIDYISNNFDLTRSDIVNRTKKYNDFIRKSVSDMHDIILLVNDIGDVKLGTPEHFIIEVVGILPKLLSNDSSIEEM